MGNKDRRDRSIFISLSALYLVAFALSAGARAEEAGVPPEGEPIGEAAPPSDDAAPLEYLPPERISAADSTLPLTAGWDKKNGFFLSDKDKLFLLSIGGNLQIRYTFASRNAREGGPPEAEIDRSSIEIERARLVFRGHVLDPNITYCVQLDADTDREGGVEIVDGYVLYKAGEYFTDDPDVIAIGAGQWKPYFLRQEATSSSKQQLVERSLTNEFFNVDRNLGVWVQGALQPFFYSFAVTNGFDSINVAPDEVDQIPAFLGKLDFSILGFEGGKYEESNVKCEDELQWTVGLSLGSDQNNGTSEDARQRFKCYQFGVDTVLKYGIFSLQSEYIGRWLDYPVGNTVPGMNGSGDAQYASGFYIQGGMFLVPGSVEVVGRYSGIWGTGDRNGDGYEIGPGLNWFISKSHNVKLQTDLIYYSIASDVPAQTESLDSTDPSFSSSAAGFRAGERGWMWRVQFQLKF